MHLECFEFSARLAWLIGNTTPLVRGSGTVAELTLDFIFTFHGLQAPILKPEFPQLDVLDITFPLDDYMKLFPYFCEPASLPEHLRKPSLPYVSMMDRMKAYYDEINGITLIPREEKTTMETKFAEQLPPSVLLSSEAPQLQGEKKSEASSARPEQVQQKNTSSSPKK